MWDSFNSGGAPGGMGMMPGMQGMPPQQPQSFSSFDDIRSQSNITLTDDFDDDFGFTDPASRQSSTFIPPFLSWKQRAEAYGIL